MLLVVHAGAGHHPPSTERAFLAALEAAAAAGWAVLAAGGGAADAVVAAVASLEACSLVNAGLGGSLTWDGAAEADASLADGDGAAAGVGAVAGLASPVTVAAALAADVRRPAAGGLTRPTLLAGDGARAWAAARGLPAALDAAAARECNVSAGARARWAEWRRAVEADEAPASSLPPTDTVGAVAIAAGHAAAASSSGGAPLRHAGRVGSAAIVGAGVAAIDARARGGAPPAAAAATGVGEAVVRHRVAAAALDAIRSPAGGHGVAAIVRTACADRGPHAPPPGVGTIAVRGGGAGARAEIVVAHGAAALPFAVAHAGGVTARVLRRDAGDDVVVWGKAV